MSDALTVMEKLAVYRHGVNHGDLAEVRLAVKESLWLADLDATPSEVARTVEFLAEVQRCLERQPNPDQHGALDAIERARAYWLEPERYNR